MSPLTGLSRLFSIYTGALAFSLGVADQIIQRSFPVFFFNLRRSSALLILPLIFSSPFLNADPAATPAPPVGTPVDLSKSHDFAVPQNITTDGSSLLPGLCTLADFQALTEANRYVYSFETWPLAQDKIGGPVFTFPFHLGDAVSDEKITLSENGPFPPTNGRQPVKSIFGIAAW